MRHRADLAVLRDTAFLTVEVELTPRASRRPEAIVPGWRWARWVAGVRYYAAAGVVADGLARAIERTHADGRVEVRTIPRTLLDAEAGR